LAKPHVLLLVPNFQPHDAVGNDVLGMYETFRGAGYDTRILAADIHPAYRSIAASIESEAGDLWLDPAAILIYHHSIHWILGERILRRSKNRIVIKYHNVTPPEFFAPYAENYYRACVDGVEATKRLARLRIDFVWGASQYNADEFVRLGVPAKHCRAVPPIHRIEEIARTPLDAVVTGTHRGAVPNILYVGAFRPHKGHFKALEVFAAYRRLGASPARLFFVGSFDPALDPYVKELEEYARQLELDDYVAFSMSVSPAQLRSFYHAADVFLCVSEHEGFCVPLVEAMYFRTPIVAWASTAVGETCGDCGLIFDRFDAGSLAQALDRCLEDPCLARRLATEGRLRYERMFHPDALRAGLLNVLEEVERS